MTSLARANTQDTGLISYAARCLGVSRVEVMRVLSTDCPIGADFDLLVEIAAVTGAELADLIPGVDRRDRPDPRTGVVNPHAHQDSEVTVYAEDASGLVTEVPEDAHEDQDEPDGEPEFEAIKAELFADLAEVLDASAERVQALLDLSTATDLEPRLRHALLMSRVRAGRIRRIRGRHAVAA